MADHDVETRLNVQESSRPHRQYEEDEKKNNRPARCKRVHQQKKAVLTNWFSPFLWTQIELAAQRAGKPWSPCAILKQAQQIDSQVFKQLTKQVIGHWIDPIGKQEGKSWWKDSVLAQVAKGNSPHGHIT